MVSKIGKCHIRLGCGLGRSLMSLMDGAGDSHRKSGSRTGAIRGQTILSTQAELKGLVTAFGIEDLIRDGAIGANLPCRDVVLSVSENKALCSTISIHLDRGKCGATYGSKIDNAHGHRQDTGGCDDSPECQTHGFLAVGVIVEIAEHGNAEDNHHKGQEPKAGLLSELRPMAVEVMLEDREF